MTEPNKPGDPQLILSIDLKGMSRDTGEVIGMEQDAHEVDVWTLYKRERDWQNKEIITDLATCESLAVATRIGKMIANDNGVPFNGLT